MRACDCDKDILRAKLYSWSEGRVRDMKPAHAQFNVLF